jgi:hypothetical protein
MKQRIAALSILVLFGTIGAAADADAQIGMDCRQSAFTIVGARVFDGEQWLPAGTQVRVQHGLVLAVGPDVGLARGGIIIDATGKTLLPEQAGPDADTAADRAGGSAENPSLADKLQSGYGAIVTGARADLRLVEGDSGQSRSGFGAISARWKDGVLVGRHSVATSL